VEVQLHAFLTSALDGHERSTSRPGRFTPGKEPPDTHWIGSWVGRRAGLDAVAKRKKSLFLSGIDTWSWKVPIPICCTLTFHMRSLKFHMPIGGVRLLRIQMQCCEINFTIYITFLTC